MGLKNMVHSKFTVIEDYALSYEWRNSPGSGFSFPCDKDGNRYPNPGSDENYENCVNGTYDVEFLGIADYSRPYTEPAYGQCECGRTVYLDRDFGHGIDCNCGRIYNMSGSELNPRSQWEERWEDDSANPYCYEFGYVRED